MRNQPIMTPLPGRYRGTTRFGALAMLLVLGGGLAVLAGAPGSARGADVSDEYRIATGDVLRVEVIGKQDVSNVYTVSTEGTITLPVVGTVTAAGKTTNELASDLSRRFSLFGRDIPQVRVSVSEYRSRSVYVLGAVLLPGVYSFPRNPSVWDAISEAGGSTEDAKLSAVELIRARTGPGVPAEVIDVEAAIREGRLESLPRLGPGDTVRVPRGRGGSAGETIYIFGAIGKPGSLGLEQAPDLVSAVIRSGGPGADADLERVEIVRKSGGRVMRLRVNLKGYFKEANTSGNPPLEPGDTVFLPHGWERQSTLGTAFRKFSPILALAGAIAALVGRR